MMMMISKSLNKLSSTNPYMSRTPINFDVLAVAVSDLLSSVTILRNSCAYMCLARASRAKNT